MRLASDLTGWKINIMDAAEFAQAFEIGHKVKLDPTLILAIMAIESG